MRPQQRPPFVVAEMNTGKDKNRKEKSKWMVECGALGVPVIVFRGINANSVLHTPSHDPGLFASLSAHLAPP
jgi:hypothetical protein